MAQIVLGLGTSHSPLLVLGGASWEVRAADDRRSTSLVTTGGRSISYAQLLEERGAAHEAECTPVRFRELSREADAAVDRLRAALRSARPDVVLVVGDDQGELFDPDNQPALAIFHGEELEMRPHDELDGLPPWADRAFWAGYRMDERHRHPGAPALARQVIDGLIEEGVDVAAARGVPARRGFGHAFGFVIERLLGEERVPVLPVLLNTYFPPNVPTARRCLEVGAKLARVLRAADEDSRVAIVASGGLSHFLCEETLDREVLAALERRDLARLEQLPQETMRAGSSEIRNWLVAGAALTELTMREVTYLPVYRTAAGTGIGLAFAIWSP